MEVTLARGADQTAEVVEGTTLLWLRTLNLLNRLESAAAAASHHNTVASLQSAPTGTQINGTLHVHPHVVPKFDSGTFPMVPRAQAPPTGPNEELAGMHNREEQFPIVKVKS